MATTEYIVSDTNVIYSNCRSCARRTRHDILFERVDNNNASVFNERDTWQIIQCLGCLTIGSRHKYEDFDDVQENSEGKATHAITIRTYPRVLSNHKGPSASYYLPAVIKKVYEQTLRALAEQANVLASIGLRACIEAVCNELKIAAVSLEKRIDLLLKAGYVSNGDKKRLHAIRFLGNDAAHEIREPDPVEIRIALEIVEHLLNTVFILESRARRLELVAETYEDFVKLLHTNAAKHNSEKAISLVGLLGRQRRLVGQQIDVFELQLKTDVINGALAYLALGQIESIGGKDVQLYKIILGQAADYDIPF